jgi:hypothetical protein
MDPSPEKVQMVLDSMKVQPSPASPSLNACQPIETLTHVLDAEPWPIVHAFNCMRHIFNDSNLAVDTSGHFAEGMQVNRGEP